MQPRFAPVQQFQRLRTGQLRKFRRQAVQRIVRGPRGHLVIERTRFQGLKRAAGGGFGLARTCAGGAVRTGFAPSRFCRELGLTTRVRASAVQWVWWTAMAAVTVDFPHCRAQFGMPLHLLDHPQFHTIGAVELLFASGGMCRRAFNRPSRMSGSWSSPERTKQARDRTAVDIQSGNGAPPRLGLQLPLPRRQHRRCSRVSYRCSRLRASAPTQPGRRRHHTVESSTAVPLIYRNRDFWYAGACNNLLTRFTVFSCNAK